MGYQGSTLAAIVTDRNLWTTRANNAWGSSRVWNSGASWETNYGAEVTLYNNMVTDRDLWTTRANTAYDSGVWGSGTLWSTRYNNSYAGAFDTARIAPSANFNLTGTAAVMNFNSTVTNGTACSADPTNKRINFTRTGKYAVNFLIRATMNTGGTDGTANVYLRRNGVNTWVPTAQGIRRDGSSIISVSLLVDLSAGEWIDAYGDIGGGTAATLGTQSYLEAAFIPTPTYPH